MNFINAVFHDGRHPFIDFGEFRTNIVLPRQGRTEANQLAYFNRNEIGCISGAGAREHAIVVPVPPDCLWDEVWLSLFGWSSSKIPAFTAAFVFGLEHISTNSGVQTLSASYDEVQMSLREAVAKSVHDEEEFRASNILRAEAEIDSCLKWLKQNKTAKIEGWKFRISESGIEIAPYLADLNSGFWEIEFRPDCIIDDVIRVMSDHRQSLMQYLFYFYANGDLVNDESFIDKMAMYDVYTPAI